MIRRKINILIEEGSGRGNESQIPLAVRDRTVNTQHANIHTHTHTNMHANIYIQTYIHTCKHTFMHTYIHTYMDS